MLINSHDWSTQPNNRAGADLWAVGCLLCEMITGRVLFAGHDYYDQVLCCYCARCCSREL